MPRKTQKGQRFEGLIAKADLAISHHFYLEATAICYAIIEERLRSVLIKTFARELGAKHKIDSCLDYIKVSRKKYQLIAKYFPTTFTKSIHDWKESRNEIMHELADSGLDEIKTQKCAKEGRLLVSELTKLIMKWKKEFNKTT
jgi:hypothetical protein